MKSKLSIARGRVSAVATSNSVALIALSRVVAMTLTLITAPIIARALGPEGRGETATALAAFAIVPILASVGLPLEVRRATVTGDWRAILRASRDVTLMLIFPSALSSFVLSVFIFDSMSREGAVVAAIGSLCAPLTISWLCDQSVLIAQSRYRAVAAIQIAQSVVYVALVSIMFLLGSLSVPVVLGANILGSLMTFVLGLALTKVGFSGPRVSRRRMVVSGFRYAGSGIAEAASNRLDQLLVLPLIGAYASGLYSVAVTICSVPLSLGHALGAHFFNEAARAERPALRELCGFGIRAGVLASAVVAVVIGLLTPFAVPLVFGDEFEAAIPVVIVSLVGSVAMTTSYVGSMILGARGKGGLMTSSQVVSLVTGLVALYLLAPRLEALGAALASTISYCVLLLVVIVSLRVRIADLRFRYRDFRNVVQVLR